MYFLAITCIYKVKYDALRLYCLTTNPGLVMYISYIAST